MKTESLSSWMSYETKSALRHHRISQHLQVSCRLFKNLNLEILMNLTLKCVQPRVIPHARWEHTLLWSNGGAVLPLGFSTSGGGCCRSVPEHGTAQRSRTASTLQLRYVLGAELLCWAELLPLRVAALLLCMDIMKETSQGGEWSPLPSLNVKP